jgi:membrane protease subunit (stomatin/prohibitin family)
VATLLCRVQCDDDESANDIAHRVPESGQVDIAWGSMATVHEQQAAVFYSGGRVLEVLGPGRHVLSPALFPHLRAPGAKPDDSRPISAAIYFVNQRVFAGVEWASTRPATFHDPTLGVVDLCASGVYAMRVTDPGRFIEALAGSDGRLVSNYLHAYLKETIVARFDDLLTRRLTSLVDLPAFYNEFATETRLELREDFARFGVNLIDFFLTSIVPTEDAQKALDMRGNARPNATEDMQRFGSIPIGRSATSGGIGFGSGMSLVLPQAFVLPRSTAPGPCPTCFGAGAPEGACSSCHKPVPPGAGFCPSCGTDLRKY